MALAGDPAHGRDSDSRNVPGRKNDSEKNTNLWTIVKPYRKQKISFYDASYLGLAHKEKAFLIIADKSLLKACQKDFKWIRFQSPGGLINRVMNYFLLKQTGLHEILTNSISTT